MRNSLRSLVDSGMLNAQAAPVPIKKKVAPTGGPDGEPVQKFPTGAPGQQPPGQMQPPEVHVHLHPADDGSGMEQDPNDLNPSDPDSDPEDPSDEEQDGDPSDAQQPSGSPMAQNVAQTMQDPLGATKKTFGNLTKAKLAYQQAQEEAKRQVIPAMSVLQHVSNAHGLQPAQPAMDPNNPDQAMGYDQSGNPQNMTQTPGNSQMNNPQNARLMPGQSPAIPGGTPGNAATGAQTQVRPPKMGVPKPGQSQAGTKAGNPGQDAKKGAAGKKGGKSVKVEVQGASDYRRGSRRLTSIEAAANLHNLRF